MRSKLTSMICVFLVILVFLSQVGIAYADESQSYYLIQYNGEKQEIIFEENAKMILHNWTDDTNSSIQANLEVQTGKSSIEKEITLNVSQELQELVISEGRKFLYKIEPSDTFSYTEVKSNNPTKQALIEVEQDNFKTTTKQETTKVENEPSVNQLDSVNDHRDEMVATEEVINPLISVSEQNAVAEKTPSIKQSSIHSFKSSVNSSPSITYNTHIQGIGWQPPVFDGKMSGTKGQAKRLESIKISVDKGSDLGVKYTTHVQNKGWLQYVTDGKESGTVGEAKRLEAIKIELTGNEAGKYDVFYRVHAQDHGWMSWVKNGAIAGTTGEGKRLEAIEIKISKKGPLPDNTTPEQEEEKPGPIGPSVVYKSHVQGIGWLSPVLNGKVSGTIDQGRRLEAIQISLENSPYPGAIEYSTYVQDSGWQGIVLNGATSGTTGKQKHVEALKVKLTGEVAKHYDIFYRVNTQPFGWLGWAKNNEPAGTESMARQIEAVEIKLVNKGGKAPNSTGQAYINDKSSVIYSTHVETFGWMNDVSNGTMSGTKGQSKRLEAIKIKLQSPFSGGISYTTHVQNYGWLKDVSNGKMSGTSGQAKRLEAIKIKLTGDISKYYDVYYRVHIQGNGWLGWAKNGMKAGSEGLAKRLEGIEIKIVPKGEGEQVYEYKAFKQPMTVFLDPGHGGRDPGAVAGGYTEANLNLTVAKKVQSLLKGRGYKVYMARTGDTAVDLLERSVMVNDLATDIFVSIHHNAGSKSANGIETYYYKYNKDYQPKINGSMHDNLERIKRSITLSELIHKNMLSYTGANDRGVAGSSFSVVREAAMPATLLELGFITNQNERNKLTTDAYQNKLAKAIADGIDAYFKIYSK